MRVGVCVPLCACVRAWVFSSLRVLECACVCVRMCVYVSVYVCAIVCVCVPCESVSAFVRACVRVVSRARLPRVHNDY